MQKTQMPTWYIAWGQWTIYHNAFRKHYLPGRPVYWGKYDIFLIMLTTQSWKSPDKHDKNIKKTPCRVVTPPRKCQVYDWRPKNFPICKRTKLPSWLSQLFCRHVAPQEFILVLPGSRIPPWKPSKKPLQNRVFLLNDPFRFPFPWSTAIPC